MPVMAVHNENQHEQTDDYRSRPRWSAGKKMDAVLRLLRGEPLEALSREQYDRPPRAGSAWRAGMVSPAVGVSGPRRPARAGRT
jgi:hypothetical protein